MEQAVRFGRDNHLVGVLSRSEQSDGARIVAILPNAGFMPRIGPFRLHVFLARALAKVGVDTLRFDLSGLGDSSTPRSREQLLQRKNADLVDAVSLIQAKRKPSRILLIGLCSGAIDSHRVALVDDRVDGIVMLDPVAYPDRLYHILYFLERALNPVWVFNYLRRRLSAIPPAVQSAATSPRIHKPTPVDQFAQEVDQNTAKGLRYLFVYFGNSGKCYYNHRYQLYSILKRSTPKKQVAVEFFRECNHTLTLRCDRERVMVAIINWIKNNFQR